MIFKKLFGRKKRSSGMSQGGNYSSAAEFVEQNIENVKKLL